MYESTKRVLLIDDDKDDHVLFKYALESVDMSLDLLHARDGLEALNMLSTTDPLPDYIFLDLNMPVMDGKQCLKEIKKRPVLSHIPVFICTTSNYEKDIEDSRMLGAQGFATKSPYFHDLVQLLEFILVQHPAAGIYLDGRFEVF
jgi:CheY-like chemotaxis protein